MSSSDDKDVRADEDVELDIGEKEDQLRTLPRRESTSIRVKPRRYREEDVQTTPEEAKLSTRMKKRRQTLAKQRDKSTAGMGWIIKNLGGGVWSATSSEAVMLENLVKK